MKTFTIYADPGHAWVKVPMRELQKLNIADRITPYSYKRGEHAYLEEDMDLSTFVMAYRQYYNSPPKFTERHTNRSSKIRSYAHF